MLLDDLERAFLEKGFRHLTVGDMASLAKASRRTLYGVGQSKEEIVVLVIDRYFNRMGKDARGRADARSDVREQVEAYVSASVDRNRKASPQFIHDVESYLPTRQLYDRHQELAVRVLAEIVGKAMDCKEITHGTPALWAEILDAVITRIRDPEVLKKAGTSRSDALATFAHFCRAGLG